MTCLCPHGIGYIALFHAITDWFILFSYELFDSDVALIYGPRSEKRDLMAKKSKVRLFLQKG